MSGFNNPIIGGGGSLEYPAIKSPNFSLAGRTGWAIMKDGSAYFFDVTAVGNVTADELFLYNGTPARGTLFCAISETAGSDAFGNNYGQGLNVGVWSAVTGNQEQHFGVDANGNLYLANGSGLTTIYANPDLGFLGIYNSLGTGTGNLIASLAAAAGTDAWSNSFVECVAAYVTLTGTFAGIHAVELADQSTPYGSTLAGLTIRNLTHPPYLPPGMAAANDASGSRYRILSGAGAATDEYMVFDTWSAGANPYATWFPGALATFGPAIGSGPVVLGTVLVTPTAGGCQLVADTWNRVGSGIVGPIATPPNFATGWSNYLHSGVQMAYRMTPDNKVEMEGVITPAAGAAALIFTLPGAYAPASIHFLPAYNTTTGAAGYVSVSTLGAVSLGGIPLTTSDEYWINGHFGLTN